MPKPVISYHPALEADQSFLLRSRRPLERRDLLAILRAGAVLLPQAPRADLYRLVAGVGRPHFPRAGVYFCLDGKVGNHRLFRDLGLPQPPTLAFEGLEQVLDAWREGRLEVAGITPPLVVKGAGGGEGSNVFLVREPGELAELAGRVETFCARGPSGLVVQKYLDGGGGDARVVLLGRRCEAFWRRCAPGEFRSNLSNGGRVDRRWRPAELERAVELARRLQEAAGLDVAAVDILVPPGGEPLLLELNFYFGRRALGGSDAFLQMYLAAVRRWLEGLGLDPQRVRLYQ